MSFPDVVAHAERPLLRTAPAPMFLLSRAVRDSGIKVVLTGEGADELFAGYDLFREAKVRRFWARQPDSTIRPLLLGRLYPYLERSPVGARAMAPSSSGATCGVGRARVLAPAPMARHGSGPGALRPPMREATATVDVTPRLLGSLPPAFGGWDPLGQDQYLEVRTLLSGYLLSSQGDRMLMAHSVEGPFPVPRPEVASLVECAASSYQAARPGREACPQARRRATWSRPRSCHARSSPTAPRMPGCS